MNFTVLATSLNPILALYLDYYGAGNLLCKGDDILVALPPGCLITAIAPLGNSLILAVQSTTEDYSPDQNNGLWFYNGKTSLLFQSSKLYLVTCIIPVRDFFYLIEAASGNVYIYKDKSLRLLVGSSSNGITDYYSGLGGASVLNTPQYNQLKKGPGIATGLLEGNTLFLVNYGRGTIIRVQLTSDFQAWTGLPTKQYENIFRYTYSGMVRRSKSTFFSTTLNLFPNTKVSNSLLEFKDGKEIAHQSLEFGAMAAMILLDDEIVFSCFESGTWSIKKVVL